MRNYSTFEEIEYDLKRLKLEKQISWEKLKVLKRDFKNEIKEDLKPVNWVSSIVKLASKYGVFILLKSFIKKK